MAISDPEEKGRPRLARLAHLADRLGGERVFFLLARLLYRLTIEGEERIPTDGACLFAYNHECLMTDALVYIAIRRRRPEPHLFSWQSFRGERPMFDFLTHFGEKNLEERYLRVYKARGLSAGELLRARGVLQRGGAVMVAPEGELTWDGRFQYPLTRGAAWLALRTGAPVVPIVTTGGYDIGPRWQMDHLRLTGRVKLRIGSPFVLCETLASKLNDEMIEAANQTIWERMAELLPAESRPLSIR